MAVDPNQPKPSLAKLLKHGVDPNALSFEDTGQRRTLLCLAIEEAVHLDDFSKVDLLLEAKADPSRRSETGVYPLQLAVKHSNVQLARKLLQAKADANQADEKLVSALHIATHQDSSRMIQLLLMHKANVNATDKVGQPPVFFASSREVTLALVEAQADILHLNKKGQSALHLAAHNGAYEAVVFLTDHEQMRDRHIIDLQDERGRTALHHAAARAHQRVVSRLMDVGANPRLKTNHGQTAMSLADAKDVDVAYYIYTRVTGGNQSTWREMMNNPIFLTMAAVLGVAFWLNRTLLWEFFWDLFALTTGRY
ncbi:unnamed protein product [Polarella glacialis]|uniref:Uncharacterized protein n=1 Tax=Polarella glacialis TaxID=89957 RepID=A0A813KX23_POLGL|nr:unnamed protein product [Polarella glacialis]